MVFYTNELVGNYNIIIAFGLWLLKIFTASPQRTEIVGLAQFIRETSNLLRNCEFLVYPALITLICVSYLGWNIVDIISIINCKKRIRDTLSIEIIQLVVT